MEEKVQDFTQKLINTALAGKHREFELITTFSIFVTAIYLYKANKKIIRGTKETAKNFYNTYIEKLKQGVDDIQLIVNHKIFDTCTEFYKIECMLIRKSIIEYIFYLLAGNLFKAVLAGEVRPTEDMYSYVSGEWVGEVVDDEPESFEFS